MAFSRSGSFPPESPGSPTQGFPPFVPPPSTPDPVVRNRTPDRKQGGPLSRETPPPSREKSWDLSPSQSPPRKRRRVDVPGVIPPSPITPERRILKHTFQEISPRPGCQIDHSEFYPDTEPWTCPCLEVGQCIWNGCRGGIIFGSP
jgi:hypothetical protein